MKNSATESPQCGDREAPGATRRAGLSLQWKLALLVLLTVLLGAAVWYGERATRPFKDGNPSDFWYAACGVQIDPARKSRCRGPVYPARDGWFIYDEHLEGLGYFHGADICQVREDVVLAGFRAVVYQLEDHAYLDGPGPQRAAVIDRGYRAWRTADPGQEDAHALLACIRNAWFDRYRELDDERARRPAVTLGATAVAVGTQPGGQPWAALVSLAEAEHRLRVFKPPSSPYSAYRSHQDAEKATALWWERAKYRPWHVVVEFCYLFALVLVGVRPWLFGLSPWRWGLHLGLLPVLFFLPYWLGYAYWSDSQLGLSGGVLYPVLIERCRRLPGGPLDDWAWERIPLLLYSWSYPGTPNTPWFQADLKVEWFRRRGPGPVTILTLSTILGLMVYGGRRVVPIIPTLVARAWSAAQLGEHHLPIPWSRVAVELRLVIIALLGRRRPNQGTEPMHIQLSRVIDLPISPEILHEVLTGWSVLAGFTEENVSPGRWVFRRGSAWLAPWTFDVRKVPTEVIAVHLPISGQVAVSLVCSSVWQVALPHERRLLEDDFDQLCACLCAAPGQERDRPGEEVRRCRQQSPPGAITRGDHSVCEDGQR
jgi:hypothetical protein